jgi:hypothetical protein
MSVISDSLVRPGTGSRGRLSRAQLSEIVAGTAARTDQWRDLGSRRVGGRLAAASLQALGLANATDLAGGFHAWAAAGLPVTAPQPEGYSRLSWTSAPARRAGAAAAAATAGSGSPAARAWPGAARPTPCLRAKSLTWSEISCW